MYEIGKVIGLQRYSHGPIYAPIACITKGNNVLAWCRSENKNVKVGKERQIRKMEKTLANEDITILYINLCGEILITFGGPPS